MKTTKNILVFGVLIALFVIGNFVFWIYFYNFQKLDYPKAVFNEKNLSAVDRAVWLSDSQKVSSSIIKNSYETNTIKINPVYVTVFAHNEQDIYWENFSINRDAYLGYRNDLVAKVNLIKKYGATFNWETDRAVVDAVLKWENQTNETLFSNTDGKNLVRWMHEDMGVSIDSHGAKDGSYSLADIAYLINQTGVEPSDVIGGALIQVFDPSTVGKFYILNTSKLMGIDEKGDISGKIYNYRWSPKIITQRGSFGHAFDDFSSGVWRPLDSDYFENNPNGKLINIGQGYPHYLENIGEYNSGGSTIWASNGSYIKELVSDIDSRKIDSGKIYTASVHLVDSIYSDRNSTINSYEGLRKTLEDLKPLADSGKIVYANYDDVASIWKEQYAENPNRLGIEYFSFYTNLTDELLRSWNKFSHMASPIAVSSILKQSFYFPEPKFNSLRENSFNLTMITTKIKIITQTNQNSLESEYKNCISACESSDKNNDAGLQLCKCGDGVCDIVEQTRNLCLEDCS